MNVSRDHVMDANKPLEHQYLKKPMYNEMSPLIHTEQFHLAMVYQDVFCHTAGTH